MVTLPAGALLSILFFYFFKGCLGRDETPDSGCLTQDVNALRAAFLLGSGIWHLASGVTLAILTNQSLTARRRENTVSSTTPDNQVHWFRHSSPYINAHRGRTFVVMLAGELLTGPAGPADS